MIGLFIFVVYAVSAWYVLKQLPNRRAKTIVWAIIVLTWGPALFIAFAPPSPSQPGAEAAYIGKFVEVLLAVGLPLMPLTAIGLGIARVAAAPQSKNIIVGITVFLGFFVLFVDEIAGRIYLNHLCTTEAGVKVYQTVELPAKYWDEQGMARFLKPNGDLDKKMLSDRFEEHAVKQRYSDALWVSEYRHQVKDGITHETLGEVVNFMYWGGWVRRILLPHSNAGDCKTLHGNQFWREFYLALFRRV